MYMYLSMYVETCTVMYLCADEDMYVCMLAGMSLYMYLCMYVDILQESVYICGWMDVGRHVCIHGWMGIGRTA